MIRQAFVGTMVIMTAIWQNNQYQLAQGKDHTGSGVPPEIQKVRAFNGLGRHLLCRNVLPALAHPATAAPSPRAARCSTGTTSAAKSVSTLLGSMAMPCSRPRLAPVALSKGGFDVML